MARIRLTPIDRLIALLREMDAEELLMAQGAIRAFSAGAGRIEISGARPRIDLGALGAELAERAREDGE